MKSSKNVAFSTKLQRLEEIYNCIKTIETDNLEQLIELYEEGMKLSKSLQESLVSFELKVTEITTQSNEESIKIQQDDVKDQTIESIKNIEPEHDSNNIIDTPNKNKSKLSTKIKNKTELTDNNEMQGFVSDLFSDMDESE